VGGLPLYCLCRPVAIARSTAVALRVVDAIDDDIALFVTTSGTTWCAQGRVAPAAALTVQLHCHPLPSASRGGGCWLCRPSHTRAVSKVLVRSPLACTAPGERMSRHASYVRQLPAAVAELCSGRRSMRW